MGIALAVTAFIGQLPSAESDDCIYVSNGGVGDEAGIAIIDAQTLSVAGKIPRLGGIFAVDPKALYLYALDTNAHNDTVIVTIDLRTNSLVSSRLWPAFAAIVDQLVVSPDGRYLYAFSYVNPPHGNEVVISLDLLMGEFIRSPVHFDYAGAGFDLTPDGQFIYVAHPPDGLTVLETAGLTSVGDVSGYPQAPVRFPFQVVVNPDPTRHRAYTLDDDELISIIDTSTNRVVKRVSNASDCHTVHDVPNNCGVTSLAMSADGSFLYVVNANDESISAMNTSTETFGILDNIGIGYPWRICDTGAHPLFAAAFPGGNKGLAVTHYPNDEIHLDCESAPPRGDFVWVASREMFRSPAPVFLSDAFYARYGQQLAVASVPSGCVGAPCVGGCDGTGPVTASEVDTAVEIALGDGMTADCPALDRNGDEGVTIEELVRVAWDRLRACIGAPSPTPSPSSSPTQTPPLS